MRRYAKLFVESTNTFSIIYRDIDDPADSWSVLQEEIHKEPVAQMLVDALNAQERTPA